VFLNGPDDVAHSSDHREVLRRLVELAGDRVRLVTPGEMIAERAIELGGTLYPVGTRPSDLVNLLDDLVRVELAERVVPIAGDSSYRPTDLGVQSLRDCDR
jgi:hypothetical protein